MGRFLTILPINPTTEMKLPKLLIVFFSVLALTSSSFAATSGVGCYIPSKGKIYPNIKSGIEYRTTGAISITGQICALNGATTSCKVKFGSTFTFGTAGSWNVIYCPIDDYVLFLLPCILILGFFFIRKKQLLLSLSTVE